MRRTTRLIRGLAAVALVPVLGLTAACGGGDDDAADGGSGGNGADGGTSSPTSGTPTGSPENDPASGPTPLTGAELERAALVDGEDAAGFAVRKPAMDVPTYDFMEYRADPEVCQPLVGLAEGAWDVDPAAEANRRVDLDDEELGASVDVQLRSYASGGAERVMDGLRTAGEKCADGFTEDRSVAEAPYLSVEEAPEPERDAAVEDVVSYRFSVQDVKDEEIVFVEYLTVVRSRATTLAFRAQTTEPRDHAGVPQELVTAQLQRYAETTG